MISTTTYKNWKKTIDVDQILWLTLDRHDAAVNALNAEILLELDQILTEMIQEKSLIGLIIQSGKSSGFIAGADIEQFVALENDTDAFKAVRDSQLILDKLALMALKMPTLALIKGFCLGGGLELALACQYRIADDSPKTIFGAPEVQLGLHPGWGGTVRLPALIGLFPAMRLNLSGTPVHAKIAAKLKLIDAIVPERHLIKAARHYILNKPAKQKLKCDQTIFNLAFIRPWIGKIFYKKLAAKISKSHYPAPYAIVDNWVKNGIRGEAAMVREAESIAELMMGKTSRNLVRAFFLQTRLKGLAKDIPFSCEHVHVIGAGVMGGDIAAWCALKGFKVTLQDQLPELLSSAIARANALYQKKLKAPHLIQAALDRLMPDIQGMGISQADVVIEAVSEKIAVKESLYKKIESQLKSTAILATNTSSLPLDQLCQFLKDPTRLVGIHFFNPVAKMTLVEIVQGEKTDPKCLEQAIAFVRRIDRLPLPVKSCPGFLVNRVLIPYLMEAMTLLDEGHAPEVIDQAALAFGMPMGPIELADTVGLDICLSVAEVLMAYKPLMISEKLKQKIAEKQFGRKSGAGFYVYQKGKKVQQKVNAKADQSLIDRLILPMINESITCLQEKIVTDADLLDAGLIFGAGFAPFRGGPSTYAKENLAQIIEKLHALQQQHGDRFKPADGWDAL